MSTLADAWLHTLDPFAIEFSDGVGVRWYGLAYIAGFLVAWFVMKRLARRGLILIPEARIADAMLWLVGGVIVGGRLGYVFFYRPELLWEIKHAFPWWGVLAINDGGMASHGGMIGVIVAAWRISRGFKPDNPTTPDERIGRCSPLHVMDVTALAAPFGLLFGRLANFVNGELLARVKAPPGQPGPWWSVRFPQELSGWRETAEGVFPTGHAPALDPAQRDALFRLVGDAARPGDGFEAALKRVIANASRYADRLEPLLSARYPSQLLQALAEGVVVGLVVWIAFARPRKPGVVGCWFLISYGVLRILTELVRLPDEGLGRTLGLSRGQWFSVAMVLAGVVALVLCARRPAERLGGWLGSRKPTDKHSNDAGPTREQS